MNKAAIISAFAACLTGSSAANALTLAECTRVTHASHGGEAGHRDLGEGRVTWRAWWSNEGSFRDVWLVECASGEALSARVAEFNIKPRAPFDRTDKALDILERHQNGARVFATFERIAADLKGVAKDIEISTLTDELCACAALYGDLRGDRKAFQLKG